MGLFSTAPTSTPPSAPKPSSDGAFEAPNRSARAICWEARDAFFSCLDAHGIVDSIKDRAGAAAATKHCGQENAVLEQDCASSWVRVPNPFCCLLDLKGRGRGKGVGKEDCAIG